VFFHSEKKYLAFNAASGNYLVAHLLTNKSPVGCIQTNLLQSEENSPSDRLKVRLFIAINKANCSNTAIHSERVIRKEGLALPTRSVFIGVILGLCSLSFGLNFFSKKSDFSAIPPLIEQKTTCAFPDSTNPETFRVYVTDGKIADIISDLLCQNSVLRRQFGAVETILGQSDYDTFRSINYGIADLALVKSNVIEAFKASTTQNLQSIASYPDYSAYFIAMREKPLLTKEYLLDKRIGLLDYPTSRSGHIAPKSVFQSLGLNENAMTIKYYNSHSELRDMLVAGEVDIISSYWSNSDTDRFSASYATQIDESVRGLRWYLKSATNNPDLSCALQEVIALTGQQHHSTYYKQAMFTEECGNG